MRKYASSVSSFLAGFVLASAIAVQAADITFTIPNPIIPELAAAMEAQYGRLPGETDAQMCRRVTRGFWANILTAHRRQAAAAAAPEAAGPDFGTN